MATDERTRLDSGSGPGLARGPQPQYSPEGEWPSEARSLDAALLEIFRQGGEADLDERAFNDLALRLFRYQVGANFPYRVFCERKGVAPQDVRRWEEIPAMPVSAFKRERVADHPPDKTLHVFETSGTSHGDPGRLYLDSLALYDASALSAFKSFMIPDCSSIAMACLTVPFEMAVTSSLIYMLNRVVQEFGRAGSRFFGSPQGIEVDEFLAWLGGRAAEPVLICGTALSFLDLFEELERRELRLKLAGGSRVFETGGFKALRPALDGAAYYEMFPAWLGVDPAFVVSEYGMTEMASQFYDAPPRGAPVRIKAGPPWVRTRVVNPWRGEPAAEGQEGILIHVDLANRCSVAALQTQDLGRRLGSGFELTGRVLGSEPRGCSLRASDLVSHEDLR